MLWRQLKIYTFFPVILPINSCLIMRVKKTEREISEHLKSFTMRDFRALRDLMILYDEGAVRLDSLLEMTQSKD